MDRLLTCTMLLAAALAGCGEKPLPEPVADLLERGERAVAIEVLSLHPQRLPPQELDPASPEQFHGYRALSRCTVQDLDVGRRILRRVADGMEDESIDVDECFNPRHGVCVATDDGDIDIVVCFECRWIQLHSGRDVIWSGAIASTPEPELTALWAEQGCPIPD